MSFESRANSGRLPAVLHGSWGFPWRPREREREDDARAAGQGTYATVRSLGPTAGLLLTILAGAAMLRCWALDFGRGVPLARPDEPLSIAFATSYGTPESPSVMLRGMLLFWGGGYLFPLLAFVRGMAMILWGRSAA